MSKPKRPTKAQKVQMVASSEEVHSAVKLMIALMQDLKLKSHVRFTYSVNEFPGIDFELTLLPIQNKNQV